MMFKLTILVLAIIGTFTVVPSIRSYSLPPPLDSSSSNEVSPMGNIFSEDAFRRQMSDTPGIHLGGIIPGSNASETVDRLRSDLMNAVKLIQEEQSRHQPMSSKNEHSTMDQMRSEECFIEITKVERLPGRCQKMHGLPVCQSDKYLNVDLAACS